MGRDGPWTRPSLDRRSRDRILRPGYLDEAAAGRVLGDAAVLAYPSLYEGFGFPPLQAMAAGVPVVATAAGAIPEVVGDGALLVAPGDVDALAGAMSGVLDGGADVDELVARGRRRSATSPGNVRPGTRRPLWRRRRRRCGAAGWLSHVRLRRNRCRCS